MSFKWAIGDRVCRHEDVYDCSSRLLIGTVIDRYSYSGSRFGPYSELYEVEWDDGLRQRGFLPHGLWPAWRARATNAVRDETDTPVVTTRANSFSSLHLPQKEQDPT